MEADRLKLLITYPVAGLLAVGSVLLAFIAWLQPIDAAAPRELALIFGMLGTAFGSASGFLFNAESATRATHAAATATQAGVEAGLATPEVK